MTAEAIFMELSQHIIKGIMFHEQLSDFYDFLSLQGFMKCHEYHYMMESLGLLKMKRFYLKHYEKLIPLEKIDNTNIIPESWYRYTKNDVDVNTKRNAVKSGMEFWMQWESDTKEILESAYKKLQENGDIHAASFIETMIKENAEEFEQASALSIDMKSLDYDMRFIIQKQNELYGIYT